MVFILSDRLIEIQINPKEPIGFRKSLDLIDSKRKEERGKG